MRQSHVKVKLSGKKCPLGTNTNSNLAIFQPENLSFLSISGQTDLIESRIESNWPGLAHPRVEDGRLVARVGADQKNPVGFLDAGDGRVQEVVGPQVGAGRVVHWEGFLRAEGLAAQTVEKIFQGNQRLEKRCNTEAAIQLKYKTFMPHSERVRREL